jgi:hypothetical protein
MSKLSILSCALILGSLACACGGSENSDDDDGGEAGSSASGGSSGAGGSSGSSGSAGSSGKGGSSGGGTGGSSGSAGTGGSGKGGSGGSSAGSGGSGGSGGSVSVPGSTPISDIDTDEEAEAVCEDLASEFDPADLESMVEGACALTGLLAELTGGGDCATLQEQCVEDGGEDPTMTEGCTADDFPDCDVTVDEYAACTSARLAITVEYMSQITCDVDLTMLGEEPAEPEECTSLVERCPELGAEG